LTIDSVCFTGNRPGKLQKPFVETSREILLMKKVLSWEILELLRQGARRFYTGMAQGIDLIAAEELLAFRDEYPDLELIAVIPFLSQTRGWSQEWIQRYELVLTQCSDIVVLYAEYNPHSYEKRNAFMVEHSDLILAVMKKTDPVRRSGSWQTVRMGLKQGKTVQAIFLEQGVVTTQLLTRKDLCQSQ
jgi:uncharacterized phage-like protein YoqJ